MIYLKIIYLKELLINYLKKIFLPIRHINLLKKLHDSTTNHIFKSFEYISNIITTLFKVLFFFILGNYIQKPIRSLIIDNLHNILPENISFVVYIIILYVIIFIINYIFSIIKGDIS